MDDKFSWTPACEESFQELEVFLTTSSELEIPMRTTRFTFYCDAYCVIINRLRKSAYFLLTWMTCPKGRLAEICIQGTKRLSMVGSVILLFIGMYSERENFGVGTHRTCFSGHREEIRAAWGSLNVDKLAMWGSDLEIEVVDHVFMKVTPMNEDVRFGSL